jgi:hypothetical protein
MPTAFQIAIDCQDPHRLVRFWAAAMDLEIEDHEAQIQELLAAGFATPDDTVELDGKLAWATAAACRSEDRRTRLLFQTVPEPKTTKNRVHLDLHVAAEERDAEVARLVELGASELWDGQQGPHRWVTLADPEGNEFCVG